MVNRSLVNLRFLKFVEHARRLGDTGIEWGVEGEVDSPLSLAVPPRNLETGFGRLGGS